MNTMDDQRSVLLARPTGYAAWRAEAEKRHDDLYRQLHERQAEASKLWRQIIDLQEVMGNGASGGTAWMRHIDQTHPPA